MLNRLPSQLPPLIDMIDDIGHPSNKRLAKAFGVTEKNSATLDKPRHSTTVNTILNLLAHEMGAKRGLLRR